MTATPASARVGAPRPPHRARMPGAFVLVLVGLGALGTACGGAAPNGVASLGKKTSTTAQAGGAATTLPPGATVQKHFQDALEFSQCMRSHGVPNFPDPTSSGGIEVNSNSGIDPRSSQFQAAQEACQKHIGPRPSLAQQAQAEKEALAFAACMRAHGLPNFPDPTFGPNGSISQGDRSTGVDPDSPAFRNAVKKCNS